jgi:hypothetical protein
MKNFIILACLSLLYSCSTTKRDYKAEKITDKTKTQDALNIAIAKGGFEIKNVLRLIVIRGEQEMGKKFLLEKFSSSDEKQPFYEKSNTLELLQSFRVEPKEAIMLFEKLKASLSLKQRELAWGIATAFPSAELAVHIEKHLSAAIMVDDLERELVPSMADALAENQLTSSYSIVKQGLFLRNDIGFAQAMIRLNPKKAEKDFLDYLGSIPTEELRQLNLESSNIFLCLELLNFLATRSLSPTNRYFENLFYFATSRNQSLSEVAMHVIENTSIQYRDHVAQILAGTPNWLQLAYIEKIRNNVTVQAKLLLKQLHTLSSKTHVINEIDEVLR